VELVFGVLKKPFVRREEIKMVIKTGNGVTPRTLTEGEREKFEEENKDTPMWMQAVVIITAVLFTVAGISWLTVLPATGLLYFSGLLK